MKKDLETKTLLDRTKEVYDLFFKGNKAKALEKINLIKALLDSGEIKSKELHQKNAAGKTPLDIARDITRLTGSSRPDPDYLELDSFFREKLAPRKIVIFGDRIDQEYLQFIKHSGSGAVLVPITKKDRYNTQVRKLQEYYRKAAEENPDMVVTTILDCHEDIDGAHNPIEIGEDLIPISNFLQDLDMPENSVFEQFSCRSGSGILLDPLKEDKKNKVKENNTQSNLELVMPKRCFIVINAGKYDISSEFAEQQITKIAKGNSFFENQIEKMISSSGTFKIIYKPSDGEICHFQYKFPKEELLRKWLEDTKDGGSILDLLTKYIEEEIDRFHKFCLEVQPDLSKKEKEDMVRYVEEAKSAIRVNKDTIIHCAKSNVLRLMFKVELDSEKLEYFKFYIDDFMGRLLKTEGIKFDMNDDTEAALLIEHITGLPKNKDRLDILDFLFSRNVDFKKPLRGGDTILIEACKLDDVGLVEYLMSKNVNPNQKSAISGITALHIACEKGSAPLVKLLIKKADINLRTDDGESPLSLACNSQNSDVVRLIIDQALTKLDEIDPNEKESDSKKALELFELEVRAMLRQELKPSIKSKLNGFLASREIFFKYGSSSNQSLTTQLHTTQPPIQSSPNSDPQPLAGLNSGRSVVVVEDKNGKKCPPPCNVL
ncbi:MAG: ankyrin repeat domain-containing protein [Pseudomonadota bacterium]